MANVSGWALWTIYLVVFVDLFQLTFVFPFLPNLVENAGGDVNQVALANTVNAAGEAIGGMVLGRIADRIGRRPVLLVSTLGSAVSAAILGSCNAYWMILAARAVNGLSGGTVGIANAYVADVSSAEERPILMSRVIASLGLGVSLGPIAGSFLYTLGGIGTACFSAAGVSVVNFLLIMFLLPESMQPRMERQTSATANAARRQCLPFGCWMCCVSSFLRSPCQVVFDSFANPYICETFYDGDEKAATNFFGINMTVIGIIVFVVPFFLFQRIMKCTGFTGTILLGAVPAVAGFMINYYAKTTSVFLIGTSVWITGQVFIGPAASTMITRISPPSQFGFAMGMLNSFRNLGLVVGPIAVAPLYTVHPGYVFIMPAVLCLVVVVLLLAIALALPAIEFRDARTPEVQDSESCAQGGSVVDSAPQSDSSPVLGWAMSSTARDPHDVDYGLLPAMTRAVTLPMGQPTRSLSTGDLGIGDELLARLASQRRSSWPMPMNLSLQRAQSGPS
eukprot:TRINITY_DN100199_c0_g1_i1.p1 TRINITY_DN100199_c0_g1~~TRINITY_DN100199_c0_g1_i1.p1  ORF type:complete len:506 (+),score=38.68 TRINITY_DN100199_c0_g1_i1:58-1575(+)